MFCRVAAKMEAIHFLKKSSRNFQKSLRFLKQFFQLFHNGCIERVLIIKPVWNIKCFLQRAVKMEAIHFLRKSLRNSQKSLRILQKSFQPCHNGYTERKILPSKHLTILHTFPLQKSLKTIRYLPPLRTKLGVQYYRLKRV